MASEGSSSSAVDSVEKAEIVKKASDLLAQGKRNMVCGEVPKAVSLFEEAVQILVKQCGELSRDCADAYFSCGSALLELGRMETSVLGAALEGVDVEEEKEEEDNEQFEKPPPEDGANEDDGDGAEEEGQEDEETQDENDEENDNDEEKDDDVPNFQLAWEYLDLAKVIYLKSDSQEDQLKAAECHIKLGEVSMETEQHTTAAEDLENALKIQQKFLPEDDRAIAETHYQLGLAYGMGKEFELSIQHYQHAITAIEAKIASLNKLVEEQEVDAENKENRETDALQKYKDEIKELQELLPEMRNKIEDTRVEAKEMEKMKEMAKEILGLSGSTKGFGSPTKKAADNGAGASHRGDVDENGQKKATDIAHLVRKKRKPEEDAVAPTAVELKKLRQEDGAAGDAGAGEGEPEVNETSDGAVNGIKGTHAGEQKTTETPAESMAT